VWLDNLPEQLHKIFDEALSGIIVRQYIDHLPKIKEISIQTQLEFSTNVRQTHIN